MRGTRGATAAAVAGTAAVVAVGALLVVRERTIEVFYGLFFFNNGPPGVVLLWMGRLVLSHRPGNPAGRVLMAMGVISVAHVLVEGWADLALVAVGFDAPLTEAGGTAPADMPLPAAIPLFFMGWLWVPVLVLAITVLPLIFPDGTLPGPRWRIAVVVAGTGAALLILALAIDGWPTATWTSENTPTPVVALFMAGGLLIAAAAVAGIVALVRRWRSWAPGRRRPFRIVGTSAAVAGLVGVLTYPWQWLWTPFPVTVIAGDVGRYQPAVEAAVYFACLEAVQNAVRHSGATRITVTLNSDPLTVRFDVNDDGTGFRPADAANGTGLVNIEDRMSALGGESHVVSAGNGTTVSGRLPAHPLSDAR